MFIIKLRGNTTSDLKLMYGKIGEKKFVNWILVIVISITKIFYLINNKLEEGYYI